LSGNAVLPEDRLPALLRYIGSALPVTALSDTLRYALGGSPPLPLTSFVLLGGWAAIATLFAVRFFRWD
ncbi:MAG TPA: ABC transporter permease, partial [Chloroflexota bacterium]|nr:ABC transporter permease [Chloroflexota bacterium]